MYKTGYLKKRINEEKMEVDFTPILICRLKSICKKIQPYMSIIIELLDT